MIDTAPLIAEITAAFDGVSREGGVSLREGIVIDDYGTEDQGRAARLLDTDTRWQDVSDHDLEECCVSLSYFDAIGFRYYLPAYMLRDLRQPFDPLYGLSSDTVFHLRLSTDTDGRNYNLMRYSLITPQQGKAVCRFLRFMVVHGQSSAQTLAARGLTAYWNRYSDHDDK